VLGVDLGSRRIGLALSDPTRTVASPLQVIERQATRLDDHRTIVGVAREHGARTIVVGLPLSLSGKTGPAARGVIDEVAALRDVAGDELTVELHDERLTTVTAQRSLQEARLKRDARRRVVDKVAAAVMLQAYLESTA
jgi:putative Holliday junction resolvase